MVVVTINTSVTPLPFAVTLLTVKRSVSSPPDELVDSVEVKRRPLSSNCKHPIKHIKIKKKKKRK
jgi:hypothetical protein